MGHLRLDYGGLGLIWKYIGNIHMKGNVSQIFIQVILVYVKKGETFYNFNFWNS